MNKEVKKEIPLLKKTEIKNFIKEVKYKGSYGLYTHIETFGLYAILDRFKLQNKTKKAVFYLSEKRFVELNEWIRKQPVITQIGFNNHRNESELDWSSIIQLKEVDIYIVNNPEMKGLLVAPLEDVPLPSKSIYTL